LEGIRPRAGARQRNSLKNLAKKAGLALTGGSDWHGWSPQTLGDFAVDGQQVHAFRTLLETA